MSGLTRVRVLLLTAALALAVATTGAPAVTYPTSTVVLAGPEHCC